MNGAGMAQEVFRFLGRGYTGFFHANGHRFGAFKGKVFAARILHVVEQHDHRLLRQADIAHPLVSYGDVGRPHLALRAKQGVDSFVEADIGRVAALHAVAGQETLAQVVKPVPRRVIADALDQAAAFPIAQGRFDLGGSHIQGERHFLRADLFPGVLAMV